ncbi:acyl-CoA:cholesterol acyltransferase alpha ACAT1-alpha [Cardiosporidium cionae]|uniref:O-acyltransferase n=1 Tax=Cardiosporidium cionae TaxID=476202 RepID=A0ABQ7J5Z8_9APIC|nr:acyl-CoA:cholesterol acyltransferase alpha ACAT1-alpha [Cardiosporidium cionae]|eukprot:KAF8819424.1 acyl-CoA:cholesterol acyltransferase alpha ACAT1-alpha [Cardiosporidium cionae]
MESSAATVLACTAQISFKNDKSSEVNLAACAESSSVKQRHLRKSCEGANIIIPSGRNHAILEPSDAAKVGSDVAENFAKENSKNNLAQQVDTPSQTSKCEELSNTVEQKAMRQKHNIPAKNEYKEKPASASRLDHFADSSTIRQSEFRGFANLFIIVAIFYVFCNPLICWYEKKSLFDMSLARAMFDDFFFLMFMWLKLCLWSFTAFGLHKLYSKRLISSKMLTVLQHGTQSICIFYAIGQCIINAWPIIPAAFIQLLSVVYFMKMHSYTETNRKLFDTMETEGSCENYPQSASLKGYCFYLFCPVLVYETQYPLGSGFRIGYFILKMFALIGAMIVMYMACTSYIIPTIMMSPKLCLLETALRLIFPLLSIDILVFYIIFECICNLFAEITNFGDRDFYQDWWNSTCWDEFSRKWNRPVHVFLLRHIYLEPQAKFSWSPRDATVATFLFSALLHEMILAVCFRLIRMYMFLMMLLQLPLIAFGKFYRGTVVGNFIFWGGMMLGVPLLAVAYGREWAIVNYSSGETPPLRLI